MDDRDNNRNDDNGRLDYQCADEIVKEILGHRGLASKLRASRENISSSDRKKIPNLRPAKNGAYSTQYTVKRPKPPLSLFM